MRMVSFVGLGSLFLGALVLAACKDSEAIEGNGVIVSEQRVVPAFSALSISENLSAEVAVGPTALTVEMDDNLVRRVVSEVRDGVLFVEPLSGPELRPTSKARVRITTPGLVAISASGTATVAANSSATAVTIHTIDDARVELSGRAASVSITTTGASRVDCDTSAGIAEVRSNDASDVRVRVAERLSVRVTDAAKITVFGDPRTREIDASDAAKVTFVE
ncbi:MAG: hypothetical protein K0S65_528 [Labilithrix sp.]|nr:hypothetical protein [Labilithrix sp.]